MNIPLIIHNVGFIFSDLASIGVGLLILINNRKSVANITLSLVFFSAAVFITSHIAGVNTADPYLSKLFLMWNLSILFIGAFNVHAVLAFLNQDKKKKYLIALLYSTAIALTVFFVIFPEYFLYDSVPKMYFPNYYNAGPLNIIRVIYLYLITVVYMLYVLTYEYLHTPPGHRKEQIKYLTLSIFFGYLFGAAPNFLVYNIQFDPLIGMLFMVFAAIPVTLAGLKYRFLDIKVIAKGAFGYSLAVAGVGGIIALFNLANEILLERFPQFPFWVTPLFTATIVIIVSFLVWNKLRESDLMKYEFITTATHKFRTPLTHIKWATDNLLEKNLDDDGKLQIEYIQEANKRLVELTDSLVNASEDEVSVFEYQTTKVDIKELFDGALKSFEAQIKLRALKVENNVGSVTVNVDTTRIKSVIQTLLENAIHYTPQNGAITLGTDPDFLRHKLTCYVRDSGIGIVAEELPFVFSKFYRGAHARLLDTEGMGIGLFIAKEIVEKHRGKMWIESPGPNKGSTVYFTLPISS